MAEAEDVVEALVEAHLQVPATVLLLRETPGRGAVVEDEEKAGVVVVAEGVEEETEPSRKDRDRQTHNPHHNPVALASLVVA